LTAFAAGEGSGVSRYAHALAGPGTQGVCELLHTADAEEALQTSAGAL